VRDPVRSDLTEAAWALFQEEPDSPAYAAASERLGKVRDRVRKKYGFGLYVPEPTMLRRLRDAGVSDGELRGLLGHVSGGAPARPVLVFRNWGMPASIRDLFVQLRGREPPQAPAPSEPHTLTITIDVEQVGLHDLNSIAEHVKDELRAALAELPPKLKVSPSRRLPPRLAFLRKMDEATFRRELRRYDQAMGRLTFRLIALWEEQERRGEALLHKGRVRFFVRGEDAVRKSVVRMFEAIQGKPWSHSCEVLRAIVPVGKRFVCPEHENNCPNLDCPNAKAFMRDFDAASPA
jgi:hypothetical protein